MQLYEFQAKSVFQENGLPIPRGRFCKNVQEAVQAAEHFASPVVVKAQVLVGGRGLAGGIKAAPSPNDVSKVASTILSMTIKGEKPAGLLVEEKLDPTRELYAAITYDYRHKCPVIVSSSRGGVDIEAVAEQ
jgi:succinyl-CoA synthetase beta subunit